MLKKSLDWNVLETHVRKEILALLIPFREEILDSRVNNTEQSDRYIGLCERLELCEDYCRIENKKFKRPHFPQPPLMDKKVVDPIQTQNKFEELEDLITTNNQLHQVEI